MTEAGFDASGFDINDYVETPTNRIAIGNPSHLPYADGYFDMVFSDQVFEHAQRQEQIFAELRMIPGFTDRLRAMIIDIEERGVVPTLRRALRDETRELVS